MADDFIGIEIDGLEEIQAKLKKLPPAAADAGADNAYDYLLNVMRKYPARKKVTRQQAYGVTFFSEKQRRFFFWALKSGNIQVPYNRTQGLSQAWRKEGDGRHAFLYNPVDYGVYMYDDRKQSRMSKLIGWKTLGQTLKERKNEILRRFDAGVKKAIRKLGL